jgi:hypothetical protein
MNPFVQQLMMMAAAANGGSDYWIAVTGTDTLKLFGVTIDNSGNIYAVGTSGADIILFQFSGTGDIQWQRLLAGANTDTGSGVTTDGTNVYIVGDSLSVGASRVALLAKYNVSGTLQWQRSLASGSYAYFYGVALDGGGNVYAVGLQDPGGTGDDWIVAKYNSSGTLQWQRSLAGAIDRAYGVTVDGTGNVYVSGYTSATGGAGSNDLLLVKYSSTGTLQWQRSLGGAGNDFGIKVARDSSDNIYVLGASQSAGGAGDYDFILVKYNSSGTLQWQRSLGGTGAEYGSGIAIDSGNNIYVAGTSNGSLLIAKYNSSGTIQWQRLLSGAAVSFAVTTILDINIAVSSTSIHISGTMVIGGAYQGFLTKLPVDGSLTGTYGIWTYAAASMTDQARSMTSSTRSLTSSTSSLTSSTSTLSSAASNLASSKIPVG